MQDDTNASWTKRNDKNSGSNETNLANERMASFFSDSESTKEGIAGAIKVAQRTL